MGLFGSIITIARVAGVTSRRSSSTSGAHPRAGSQPVEARPCPELGQHRRVQRIGRHRHEHFAVLVDERGQHEIDRLRGAGRDEDAIARDREPARGEFLGDRFARRRDAGRRSVAVVAVAHRALDRGDEVRRRLEPERDRVADVEVADPRALRFDALRLGDDVADRVREAVDSAGDRDGSGGGVCRSHGQS